LKAIHWPLLALVALIAVIGIGQLQSAAGGTMSPWANKQSLRLVLGFGLLIVLAMVPIRLWMALAYPAYALGLILLILVILAGSEALGARRWIRWGDFGLQPSEIMKAGLILALARYYQWLPAGLVSRPAWVAIPVLAIALPVIAVLAQPDLGSAALFAAVGFLMMFLAGVSVLYFLAGASLLATIAPLIWSGLHDYQRRRITTFLDPEADPLGAGYHIAQSKIAIGSGGWSGLGHLGGLQSHLDFLPEKHTDFAFAMFAEEWGLLGVLVVLCLYGAAILVLSAMALRCANQFSRLVTAGACGAISIYVVINIAMITGLVPVVGVPLPLFSYGGTAMMTVMILLGLSMCAWVHRREVVRRRDLGPLF
jgi:rod shape determining protein RodA